MTCGIAIGNGPSRADFDLNILRQFDFEIVGCNWIYKDFTPDVLVTLDSDMFLHMESLGGPPKPCKWLCYKQNIFEGLEFYDTKEHVLGYLEINRTLSKNSGIVACSYLAKYKKCKRIYLVGFDFFRILPGLTSNDLYHDHLTDFDKVGFDVAWNWLIEDCPNTEFVRVGPIPETEHDYYFNRLKGFRYIDYPEFAEELCKGF